MQVISLRITLGSWLLGASLATAVGAQRLPRRSALMDPINWREHLGPVAFTASSLKLAVTDNPAD